MPTPSPLIVPLINGLHERGTPRIWSVIVTIFGDAVLHQRDMVELAHLQEIGDVMLFEAGAVRTSLSRLCGEGWLSRHKTGRNVAYGLGEKVHQVINDASMRIYEDNFLPEPKSWHLAILPKPQDTPPNGVFPINKTVWAVPSDSEVSLSAFRPMTFVVQNTSHPTPSWAADTAIDPEITKEYAQLLAMTRPLMHNLELVAEFAPQDALIARLLLMHFWRRIVLKHPKLYASLLPTDWAGKACTEHVAKLYRALLPRSEQWWEGKGAKSALSTLDQRFAWICQRQ